MKNNIWNLINDSSSILVLTHESPDGDAIGSAMAMYYLLKSLNKNVDVVIPEFPETFYYLNDVSKICKSSNKNYDLCIVVDCASEARIGQTNDEFTRCKKRIIIDHHISNDNYGDINLVEANVSSCCQVIYYLFKDLHVEITKEIGEALISGCLTDTNGFRNNDVDKNTFLMAAELMDSGIDFHQIYYLAISKKNMAQYLLMKMTLDRLEMFADGKIAFSYISHEDMENVGAKQGDHEGLVDLGRYIGGVEVSVFMREEDEYRISLRSNGKVNVNEIAKKFGGGGHKMAAGAKIQGEFKETKDRIINEIIKELNQ
ncbi:MAG: bifunctional oligoribonuclease/PAP phosphatase NrnA [Bacilli bacterium]|nr:bifunctional oligoribonuclease/PAP phosphatase NrnA [Bacilli bacterium]